MTNQILARMAVVISANTAEFNRGMNQMTSSLNKFASVAGVTLGGAALFNGIRYGLNVIIDFEKRMSEVRAITQATDKEFKQLRDSAIALGQASKFSAEEVAGLQVEFGKLGFGTQEILNATEATLQLATATGEDLAKSADIAGSTLRAFNLDSSEMQRVVDVMAASFNKSALGLTNFGEAIKYVAPVAAAANISLEETTAMLGVLADAGIRGSMAGTSLRKIISDVGGESGTLAEKLQKLAAKGITGADAMDEVGRTAYASLLVLAKHTEKVNEATIAYQNAEGEAKKMADLMGDNLATELKKLNSAFESLILSGSAVSKTLQEVVKELTLVVNFINKSGVGDVLAQSFKNIIDQGTVLIRVWKAVNDQMERGKGASTTWDAVKTSTDDATKALENYKTALQNLTPQLSKFTPSASFEDPVYGMDPDMDAMSEAMKAWSDRESENPVPGIVEEIKANEQLTISLYDVAEARDKDIAAMKRQEDRAKHQQQVMMSLAETVGQAFGEAATGQKKFADAMKSTIPQIIKMLFSEAMAAIITAGAKDGAKKGNVILGVAGAAAGAAAISALFSRNTSTGGSDYSSIGSFTPSQSQQQNQQRNMWIIGKTSGYDIDLTAQNEIRRRKRVG